MSDYQPITENGHYKAAYIEPFNPHQTLTRTNAKGRPGLFQCAGCGAAGSIKDINAEPCTAPQPDPCPGCGLTPICARDCPGIRDALNDPGVYVIDGAG